MKKKQALAVLLAVAMTSVTSMTAMAEPQEDPVLVSGHDTEGEEHGTKDEALVSDEESKMTIETPQGDTQFYIKIDKDASSGEVTIPGTGDYPKDASDYKDICHYEVKWEVNRSSKLSVTVPLYVCMYGYGGDGTVVTPTGDAYFMENNSTYTDAKTVTDIIGCYKVYKLNEDAKKQYIDSYIENAIKAVRKEQIEAYITEGKTEKEAEETADKDIEEDLADEETKKSLEEQAVEALNISFKNLDGTDTVIDDTQYSGEWGYFVYKENNDADPEKYLVRLSDCNIHTADSDCTNKDDHTYFYRDSDHTFDPAKADTDTNIPDYPYYAYLKDDEGKGNLRVGETYYANNNYDEGAYLPVNVPTISAERNTWNIQSMSDAKDLVAGEISMTINGVDLYDVITSNDNGDEQTLDIRDLKWTMPTAQENKLSLPVKAVIAGGNVNEEGCVPVVKVIYKVSPAMECISDTVYKLKPTDES
jgi:hypothetical protein